MQSGDKFTTRGFVSDIPGSMTVMGTLGGINSQANGVNAKGIVVGTSDTATPGVAHAFITGSDGVSLGDLEGDGKQYGQCDQ